MSCLARFRRIVPLALLAVPLTLAIPAAYAHDDKEMPDHNMSGATQGPAIGEPGKAADVTRTVRVEMADTMRFTPARIPVRKGETVRLEVVNTGKIVHELMLGTPEEIQEHLAEMRAMPGMKHEDEPNRATVEPGKTGHVIWRFTQSGTVDFACLQPGHFEAGMKGVVEVSP